MSDNRRKSREHVINFRQQMRVFRMFILVILLLLLLAVGVLFVFSIDSTADGRGVVLGVRHWKMAASVHSRITVINAREGDHVTAGTVLLELDDRELQRKCEALRNSIRELEARLEVQEWRCKLLEIDPLPEDYRHTSIALNEARERVLNAEREFATYRDLWQKQVIAELEFHRRELELVKEKAALEKLEADFATVSSGLADSIIGEAKAELETTKRQIDSARAELAAAEKEASEYVFIAPEDGVVCSIPTRTGTYVTAGEVIVEIAADGPKKFMAEIEENDIHRVSEGQQVRIESSQYDHYKHGYFFGEVMYVGVLPEERGGKIFYQVFIRITDEPRELRIGSTGNAKISVGKSKIIAWLTGMDD